MIDLIGVLFLLIGLELVLGVDNILVISILVNRLPPAQQHKARMIGLTMAMVARLLMLVLVLALASLTNPIIGRFSVRDMILLAGGLFLLWKAVKEIHHTVEMKDELEPGQKLYAQLSKVVTQIVLLDIVFSVDSVVTAIGLTNQLWVIITAVVISFVGILFVSKPIGDFILRHPAIKILALSFLITIGVTIFMEGMHKDVPKAYIYLPMGFALLVEILQMRYDHNRKRLPQGQKPLAP
jgi:predicted tellurium resistance membrane protein TerC